MKWSPPFNGVTPRSSNWDDMIRTQSSTTNRPPRFHAEHRWIMAIMVATALFTTVDPGHASANTGWTVAILAPELPLGEHEQAFRAARELFGSVEDQIGGSVTPRFFHRAEDLQSFLQNGEPRALVLCSHRFMSAQGDALGLETLLSPVVNGDVRYRLVLVRKANTDVELADLGGRKLAITDDTDDHWDHLLRHTFGPSVTVQKPHLVSADSGRSALLAVRYGAADAALVSQAEFTYLLAADKAAADILEIAWTSADLPLPVLCATPNMAGAGLDSAAERLTDLHMSEAGRTQLAGLGLDAFRAASPVNPAVSTPSTKPVASVASRTTEVSFAYLDSPTARYDRDSSSITVRARQPGQKQTAKVSVKCQGSGLSLNETATPGADGNLAANVDLSRCTATNSEGPGSYTVKPGDSLWSISESVLGDTSAYMGIARLNGINDPDLILIGATLQLPGGAVRSLDLTVTLSTTDEGGKTVSGQPTDLHLTIW